MSESLNILLCEPDRAESARLIAYMGSHGAGGDVMTVATVEDVAAVLASRTWDMVLSAHCGPAFDARQILDIVRATAPDLPVIILANEISEADCAALIIAGARDAMRKSDLSRLVPIMLREIESARTRRELSQAIGRAELHFRNIVESSLQGIMVRANARTQFVNPAFCRMFGYNEAELMAMESTIPLHPIGEQDIIRDRVNRRYQGDLSIHAFEVQGIRKDGTVFWCSKSVSIIEWNGQSAVQIAVLDITERKNAERQLAERERQYRETFENAPVALVRASYDRKITEVNTAFADMVGYCAEEIIGRRIGEFVPREDRDNTIPAIQQVWTRAVERLDTEHRMVRKDGSEIWVQSSSRLTPESSGRAETRGMLAQFQDITRRHEAEIALQERETLYRNLVEKSLQGILIIDQTAKPIFVNNVFAQMLGYAPYEILAMDAGISLYHEEDRQEIRRRMALRKAGDGSVQRYELRAIKKDGTTIWVDLMTTAIDWSGQPAVQVATIDITDRKTSARLIEESEKKYRQTFEHAPIAMTRSMRDSSIVEVNQAFADILGYTVKELYGTRISDFVAPEERATNLLVLQKVWQRDAEQAEIEHQMTRKDGRQIWVHCSVRLDSPDRTPSAGNEHEVYMLAQFQDITSRREAESELLRRETLYRNLVEQSLQGVLVADHSGKPLFVNGVFANIFGYTPDEILEMPSGLSLYHPEDQEDIRRRRTRRNVGDQSAQRYEIRGIKKDGTTIWLELLSVAIDWQGQSATQVAAIDITDRKTNAQLLEAREQKYRETFENAPTAMFRIGRDRILRDVNRAFEDLVGYTKDELSGVKGFNLIHFDDLSRVIENTGLVWAGRLDRVENEYRMIRKNGSQIWVSSSGRLTPDENGELNYLIVQLQDITARKEAEEQLRLAKESLAVSEKQFRTLFDNTPVGLCWVSTDGRYLRTNRTVQDMLGYTADELLQKHPLDSLRPDHREGALKGMMALASGKIDKATNETVHICKDGREIWVNVTINLLRDEHGQPQHILAQLQDITDRKKAEEQRDEALRSLAQNEKQYRELFEHAPVAISALSLKGEFLQTNQAHRDLLGYTEEETLRMHPIDMIEPSNRAAVGDILSSAAQKTTSARVNHDIQFMRKDGTPIWVWLSGTVVLDDDQKPSYILAHLQDISARKRAEAQLFQSQKMEALGNLAGGIAHDFNNMLLPIIGLTALSKEDLPHDSPVQENLDTVIEAAENARRIVSQILTFSRQDQAEVTAIQISSCVDEAVQLVRNILPSSITIIDQVEPEIGTVLADAAQLHSVILNLGSNAAHAMQGRVGSLLVGLERVIANATLAASMHSLQVGSPYACIHVRDSGRGMDKETLAKIFNPFFTTKPVGEGTGLGLSMVHGIIERFGGGIHVSSEVGVGTQFDIYLPLREIGASGQVSADSSLLMPT